MLKRSSFGLISMLFLWVAIIGQSSYATEDDSQDCSYFFDTFSPMLDLRFTRSRTLNHSESKRLLDSVLPTLAREIRAARDRNSSLLSASFPVFSSESEIYDRVDAIRVPSDSHEASSLALHKVRVLLTTALRLKSQAVAPEKDAILLLLNHPRLLTMLAIDIYQGSSSFSTSRDGVILFLADLREEMHGDSTMAMSDLRALSSIDLQVLSDKTSSSNSDENVASDDLIARTVFDSSLMPGGIGFPIRTGAAKRLLAISNQASHSVQNALQHLIEFGVEEGLHRGTLDNLQFIGQVLNLWLNRSNRWEGASEFWPIHFDVSQRNISAPIPVTLRFYTEEAALAWKAPRGVEEVSRLGSTIVTIFIHDLEAIIKLDNDLRIRGFKLAEG